VNLEIREATRAEQRDWDAVIRGFPALRVEHTRAWIESLAAAGLGRPLYLVWTIDGEIVGCMAGLLKRVGPFVLFGSPLPGWQTGGMGPQFDPTRVSTGQLIAALIPVLEDRYGVEHIELLTNVLDHTAMAGLGFRPEETPTFRAPLYPGDEARQLELFKDSARRNLKRAHKLGLQVRFETEESFVEPHYRQLCDVYARGGNTITFSLERVRQAFRHLRKAGALIAASVWLPDGATMIASGMFAVEGKELLLWSWAHSTRYRWYRATELLTWSIMQQALARGCETFDLMGLGDFKAKFGATLDVSKTRWVRSRTQRLTQLRDVAGKTYAWQQRLRGRFQRSTLARDLPAVACVMGDMDLIRALSLAKIPCAVMARSFAPERFTRFAQTWIPDADAWKAPETLLERLRQFGWAQPEPPALFYDTDGQLLFVSRNRDRLAQAFRFVVPDRELVEDLTDKERFQKLAKRLKLPVPGARALRPAEEAPPADLGFPYPVMLKPLTRRTSLWSHLGGKAKAIEVRNADELRALWSRMAAERMVVLAQQLIPGPETAIESYHVYVDAQGKIAGEFAGRKIRTWPLHYGHSTALETTDSAEVLALGRALVQRLKLRGVAKFDFKRSPEGQLYLLEVNARFNLWHHLGARAGVNIPALVYADLVGAERPAPAVARAGLRWCKPWRDLSAARAAGIPLLSWLVWFAKTEAKRVIALDDPLPIIGAATWEIGHRVRSLFTATAHARASARVPAQSVEA
jgi:predicted ATP-grasp superfamily ATP-dependent carboligase